MRYFKCIHGEYRGGKVLEMNDLTVLVLELL